MRISPEVINLNLFQRRGWFVNKKARELMGQSKPAEAFDHIIEKCADGLPESNFLVRELLNELVGLLTSQTGKMDYVVKALKVDLGNEKIKEYLMK